MARTILSPPKEKNTNGTQLYWPKIYKCKPQTWKPWLSYGPPIFLFWVKFPLGKGREAAALLLGKGTWLPHNALWPFQSSSGGTRKLGHINPRLSLGHLRTAEASLLSAFSVFADTRVWEVREERKGQASVASSSSTKAVTNTNYASQTCVWADLFSLWINAEWPTFLHIIYYLGCYFIDFETVLLQRNGKI